MYQVISIIFTDWILPNSEKDTPLRWTLRVALGVVTALVISRLV